MIYSVAALNICVRRRLILIRIIYVGFNRRLNTKRRYLILWEVSPKSYTAEKNHTAASTQLVVLFRQPQSIK
jgi:hypothetical protein